jgi:hypothetical protein
MSPGPIQMEGWVGPRAGMNTLKKGKISRSLPGIEPQFLGSQAHGVIPILSYTGSSM